MWFSRHNRFYFVRVITGSLRHADWDAARARWGVVGPVIEFFRALAGFNAWPFFVPDDSRWEPEAIDDLLAGYGIPTWGWAQQSGEYHFQVKLRQATWAQYLLQQQGVPLNGQLLDAGDRAAYRPETRRGKRRAANTAHPAHAQSHATHSRTHQPSGGR